jgi:hypothetical protein
MKMKKQFKFHKISPLVKQLIIDFNPAPERLNIQLVVKLFIKK